MRARTTISLAASIELARRLGPGWALRRMGYGLRKRSGLLKRRFPAIVLNRTPLDAFVSDGVPTKAEDYRAFRETNAGCFFFPLGRPPQASMLRQVVSQSGQDRTVAVADDYCRGHFLYYSRHTHDLGQPVDWLLNPFTGTRHNSRTHWCDYPTFSPTAGDIKDVWDPSRFGCAFWLVRAYALTGDDKYAEAFWTLFESWCSQNPPNIGPNWKCGQETALRTISWCFALYGFWHAPATTAERVVSLVKLIALQADRIANNIGYAVLQKNNHALSEAVGLLTVGLLFPELRGARRWRQQGRKVLEHEVRRQVYEDGSYSHQAMNYHRFMLHVCLWAIRLAELNEQPLSNELAIHVADAGEFLLQMLDIDSGRVPNYGYNDGALVLPLSPCDYRDYRPTVQATRYHATGQPVLARGPWDETLLWLYGSEALVGTRSTLVPVSRRFDTGGYYTLRGRNSWCMIRCHNYRDRPAHVDMLHLDLWYKGINILGDSGTYRYYSPDDPVMERYAEDVTAHNTIEIDERGPLNAAARWLWVPWPKARCLEHREGYWRGEHYAYDKSPWHVVHRRGVQLIDEHTWLVTDDLLGEASHTVTLRWHLVDGGFQLDADRHILQLDLPCGRVTLTVDGPDGLRMEVRRGWREGDRALGWESAYYGEHTARPTVEVTAHCQLPTRFVTRILVSEAENS